ncbi:helix-turn-helix transcriptional regulator [uncultured Clostridium sp.]|uniref:helix-turn-helix domain-containing protein n=1 Tax=uncultured Clostridium sp. TaxID=59620 RepID=UPI0025F3A5A4|nr:helix-turn-helix transcriptional regulator [uncultured Clostridium sp.]
MYKSATFATLFSVIKFNINTIILKDMELDTFAQKLKYIRLERNLNQREFAKLLNRSFTSVCNWEQGNRIPKTETIKEISEILNVDYTYLKDQ